jgi:lipopolysaccharide/colanic/teichoic acid biosynthesis glycosyltransferase
MRGGLPLEWGLNGPILKIPAHRDRDLWVKRCLDIVLASAGLIVLLPLLTIIAALVIGTSKGPAFFQQERLGKDGKPFKLLKFRTLYVDQEDRSGVAQTKADDPRVTPIGRLLRRSSFDELPQLWNVLIGDMSMVGPRPHVDNMLAGGVDYRKLVPYLDLRLAVKPGLTGWAQANGLRGPTDDAELARARIDYDIAYIQNLSLELDIKIILATIRQELGGGTGL